MKKAPARERIHLNYCKNILNVKSSTSNVMVYYELGRTPLIYHRKCRMFKYWFKLLNTSNCILQNCHRYLYDELERCPNNNSNWLYFINSQICDTFFMVIKQRLYDTVKQNFYSQLRTTVKCFSYQYMVDNLVSNFIDASLYRLYINLVLQK